MKDKFQEVLMNDYLISNNLYRCKTCGYEWKPTVLEKQYIRPIYPIGWSGGYYIAHCPKCVEGIGKKIDK